MKYKLNSRRMDDGDLNARLIYQQGIDSPTEYMQANTLHDPLLLRNMEKGVKLLGKKLKKKIGILVDDDCDGFCSASMLYKYLTEELLADDVIYYIHDGKRHGLDDNVISWIEENQINLLIVPDAHCDIELCKKIKEYLKCKILVLDHHESEKENKYAVVINPNYVPNKNTYPNVHLSGCAVTWKFLQVLDKEFSVSASDGYTDLVALSTISDVMSMKNLENRTIVELGMNRINSKQGNNFISKLVEANSFSIKGEVTPKDCGWTLSPTINAMCRIGTVEEKDVLFKAFSDQFQYYDYKKNKNTDTVQEDVYTRAVRLSKNAHSRQSKLRDTDMKYVEELIQKDSLYENKIMIINAENNVTKGLTGLTAMRIAEKYKRPTLITNPCKRKTDILENLDVELDESKLEFSEKQVEEVEFLSGSGRNYDDSYIENLKQTLKDTKLFALADGHASAMGVSFESDKLDEIIAWANENLADSEDYVVTVQDEFKTSEIDVYLVREIDEYAKKYAVNDIKEPKFLIKNIKVDIGRIEVTGKESNTLKFTINDDEDVWAYLFKAPEDDTLMSMVSSCCDDTVTLNAIGTFATYIDNESVVSQFIVKAYEVVDEDCVEEMSDDELELW